MKDSAWKQKTYNERKLVSDDPAFSINPLQENTFPFHKNRSDYPKVLFQNDYKNFTKNFKK